jgi:hypothetical protein
MRSIISPALYITASFAALLACATPALAADDEIVITNTVTVATGAISASEPSQSKTLTTAERAEGPPAIETKPAGQEAATFTPVPASPATKSFSGSYSFSIESARVFGEQGAYVLTRDPAAINDMRVCYGPWMLCGEVWRADTGHPTTHETDYSLDKSKKFGIVTVTVRGAIYELHGKDAVEAKLSMSVPLSRTCSGGLAIEGIRQGFVDNVLEATAACSYKLQGRWSADLSGQVAHSDWARRTTPGLGTGLRYDLGHGLTGSLYGKVFFGRETEGMGGLRLSKSF